MRGECSLYVLFSKISMSPVRSTIICERIGQSNCSKLSDGCIEGSRYVEEIVKKTARGSHCSGG